ncbi:aspartate aminotransferase family protein [Conexibacter stalactiti]|uniref:Aspartate aminotransferase family protein n=1 Tax=Conexibacter stalactiti TaxID=1940611 RepID=A0ABU4HJW5_9ACTN|nr:aspartate aminotransferase family protein [Conexibacter stalactiti]MDW5593562.1 aspartate aminotransferase family protein [Conexibacter stalactiti]MEC5034203.1 aspartate aminotransferase family protein [Conexibacter stalactiti]
MTSIDRSGAAAETRLWHPFSDMSVVRRSEFVLTRGEGVWVYDDQERRYLDGTASLWYANVGHGRAEIADAIAAQLGQLEAYSAFGDFTTRPAQELAARIAGLAPVDDARVFFTTGGGEALDSAAKIVRRYWTAKGEPERMHLIGRTGGYHGTNGYGTAIGGIEANRAGWGPLMSATSSVQWDSLAALEEEILRVGPERVAAVFAEPVIGAGGVLLPPPGYLEGVQAICQEHGILFVADEVICAFGRVGDWFASSRFGLRPDLITFAKGVTSGYLPLGGVVASGRVAEPFWEQSGNMLRHGATYSAHATCCAAGSANLDLLAENGLVSRALETEGPLLAALEPLAAHPLVKEVRGGVGLLAAVEFSAEALAAGAPVAVFEAARERGLLVRALGQGVAVSPPLTISQEELDFLGATAAEALDAVAAASVA